MGVGEPRLLEQSDAETVVEQQLLAPVEVDLIFARVAKAGRHSRRKRIGMTGFEHALNLSAFPSTRARCSARRPFPDGYLLTLSSTFTDNRCVNVAVANTIFPDIAYDSAAAAMRMLVVSHITPNIQLRHASGDQLRSPQRHRPTASQSAAMRSRRRKPVRRKVMSEGEVAARKKRRAWRPNGAPPRQERRRALRRSPASTPAAAAAAPTTFSQPRGWRNARRPRADDSDVDSVAGAPRVATLTQALSKMTVAAQGLQVCLRCARRCTAACAPV